MYSRKEHGARLVATFGFDCEACSSAIMRDVNSPEIGAVCVGLRDDGLYVITATVSSPIELMRERTRVTKHEHTLVHTIAVLDTPALELHLRRRLEGFSTGKRDLYALPPAVLAAVCSTSHLCVVPSPFAGSLASAAGFREYIGAVEKAVGAAGA